jgi:mannose-6-phosphate isomerase-like protein (cupin superfamily)
MHPVSSPKRIAAGLAELWSPRVVADIENVYVKVAKLHGALAWHSHDLEDELFLVLHGALRIELEDGPVDLAEGEMFIVPRGVRHNPVATEECHVLLIEAKSTLHTGAVQTDRTRSLADQLRPLDAGSGSKN